MVASIAEIERAFERLSLNTRHLVDEAGELTAFGKTLTEYLEYRASVLNDFVRTQLMNREAAEAVFNELRGRLQPRCPLPMNKQKGEKRNHSFLTGIVNMLIEQGLGGLPCDYDPRSLTTITQDGMPLRTMARRVDGAFPSVVNPVAVWEIKEYYYTTTFGSRVADGVYETLLDGLELEELKASTGRKINHLLVIDDYFTWWDCGRSYLCRMIDMLHMGYVDEVIFGREAVLRIPQLVEEWKHLHSAH